MLSIILLSTFGTTWLKLNSRFWHNGYDRFIVVILILLALLVLLIIITTIYYCWLRRRYHRWQRKRNR